MEKVSYFPKKLLKVIMVTTFHVMMKVKYWTELNRDTEVIGKVGTLKEQEQIHSLSQDIKEKIS